MISSQQLSIIPTLAHKRPRSTSSAVLASVKQARLESNQVKLNQLPIELLSQVFEHLEMFDLLTLAQVCCQFRCAIDSKSLWRQTTFKLYQDLIHQTHIVSPSSASAKQDSMRKRVLVSYRDEAHVWVLKTSHESMKIRLTYEPPTERFLVRNQLSTRLNSIKSLNLSCSGDYITQDVLINILKCLPHLVEVDLSCCHLIGDEAIKQLVSHPKRSESLQSLKLNKCFGLSYKSMQHIVENCRNLKHLDISESSGAADAYTLPLIKSLAHSLVSLNLSSSDLLIERDFITLFTCLSELGPKQCSINTLELSRNFHVTGNVLDSIYNMSAINHDETPTHEQTKQEKTVLKIIVKDCEQIVSNDITRCTDRIQFALQTNHEYSKRFRSVQVINNTKLQDHSFESIRNYIGSYM